LGRPPRPIQLQISCGQQKTSRPVIDRLRRWIVAEDVLRSDSHGTRNRLPGILLDLER
jgi:hypothetical protein